jgi:hypothetical protein
MATALAAPAFTHHVVCATVIAAASALEARDLFLQAVWFEGGGLGQPRVEAPGDPATRVGCVRRVALGVRERIVASTATLVEYTVVRGFPVAAHRGRVEFAAGPQPGTVAVTWTCDFTPWTGLGCVLTAVIRTTFTILLRTLRRRAARAA